MSDTPSTQSEPPSLAVGSQGTTDSGGTNTAVPTNQANAANNSSGSNPQDLTALITALTALPEQLARSVKEAVGTPAKPADKPVETQSTDKPAETKTTETKPVENKTPGKKSFAEWWGGN